MELIALIICGTIVIIAFMILCPKRQPTKLEVLSKHLDNLDKRLEDAIIFDFSGVIAKTIEVEMKDVRKQIKDLNPTLEEDR